MSRTKSANRKWAMDSCGPASIVYFRDGSTVAVAQIINEWLEQKEAPQRGEYGAMKGGLKGKTDD